MGVNGKQVQGRRGRVWWGGGLPLGRSGPGSKHGGCCLQVPPEVWGLSPCGTHCCQCQESGQLMSCTCGPLRSLTMLPPHTWLLVSPHWP